MTIEEQYRAMQRAQARRHLVGFFEQWVFPARIVQRIVYTRMGRNWRSYE